MKIAICIGFLGLALAAACSDDDSTGTPTSQSGDAGATPPGTPGTPTTPPSGTDAGSALNGCRTFVDRMADGADRTLPWNEDLGTNPQRCMTIKAGQSIKFTNPDDGGLPDFDTHPNKPRGGDANSPLASIPASGEVTFPTAGTFGFKCDVHDVMTGVIQVK